MQLCCSIAYSLVEEKLWMSGIADGLTEQEMYIYLITFLKAKQSKDLDNKIHELKQISKGKPFYQNIKENLAKIDVII